MVYLLPKRFFFTRIYNVGTRLAKLLALANHEVILGSRNQQRALKIAAATGTNIEGRTYKQAVHDAPVIVLAIPWSEDATIKTVQKLGNLAEKIVIDCTNFLAPDY